MKLVTLFVFVSILAIVSSAKILDAFPTSSDSLVLLHVLFRHGNRTPDKFSQFPTDPHINETFKPFGYSQLTTKGKKTEFEIGKYIRQTYGDFIPQQYGPEVAYAISTDFKRTKMSLESVLAGLFPPLDSDVFSSGLNWQPIPYEIDDGIDLIRVPSMYCTNYLQQYYRHLLSKEGQKVLNYYQDLYLQVSNFTGEDIILPEEIFNIYETLESEKDFGLELPAWTSDIFPEVLEKASSVYIEFSTATTGLKRLSTGHLLKKIIEDSLAKRDGSLPEDRKIFLYSAHDYSVGVMLRALDVFYPHVPPYGATIFFEIHNIDGTYGLKLLYQNYSQATPQLLTIPGCSSFCDLDKLVELMSNNFPTETDVCNYSGELV
ncbi:venom acid phosphatase Acph-1-like [Tribolium madens]|uniref:venom acid phosphatase Acph-1-like n=1 Tax=Tribolium madens TaxID=41895 RepID=UPI001CF76316|nr:venom acid phosphatase Acph-1-like [Tribolium madens]